MAMTDQTAIQVRGLVKSYGGHRVLDGLDLTVPAGSVYALLGGNGAGKTTAVRILATLTRPDGGRVTVAGFDVTTERAKVRQAISLTGQYAALDEVQTGAENLRMMGRLSGLGAAQARARAAELLRQFDIAEAGKRQVGTYSGGMRRRLDLAASLVARPKVIFLDEPTTGLDLPSRQALWATIAGLAAGGTTIFLTTQYLEEADRLADRIAVLALGRRAAEGTASQLKQRVAGQRLDLRAAGPAAYAELARRADGHGKSDRATLTVAVPTDGGAAHVRSVLDRLDPARDLVSDFAVHGATLDDVFLAITGHTVSEAAGPVASAAVVMKEETFNV
jgi:ABC-2 type transport system ATP-binding protein